MLSTIIYELITIIHQHNTIIVVIDTISCVSLIITPVSSLKITVPFKIKQVRCSISHVLSLMNIVLYHVISLHGMIE